MRQGSRTLVDAVIAETTAGFRGPVCDPPPPVDPNPCPRGSVYVAARNMCVIPPTQFDGPIDAGPPTSGFSGGSVLGLGAARNKYGNSRCLAGSREGKVVLVGTSKADRRLTGSNQRDRILGLGGNDRISGARNHDCIDGGPGSDTMSGELGNDRIFGVGGNDHLNGNSGSDRLNGGKGNDTINAGYGADRAFGGPGKDSINIATAGPVASADCGARQAGHRALQQPRAQEGQALRDAPLVQGQVEPAPRAPRRAARGAARGGGGAART